VRQPGAARQRGLGERGQLRGSGAARIDGRLDRPLCGIARLAPAAAAQALKLAELFPTAREYGERHWANDGLTAGMAVMALSLLLMASRRRTT
jgi:zinc transporter ZupT